MIEFWITLKHLTIHLGPATLTAAIVAWWSWRVGQLSNGPYAAALALNMKPTPERPAPPRRWRFPAHLILVAIILGFGVGVPIATVVIAMNAGGPTPTALGPHH